VSSKEEYHYYLFFCSVRSWREMFGFLFSERRLKISLQRDYNLNRQREEDAIQTTEQ